MEFYKNIEIEGGAKLNDCMSLIDREAVRIGWERDKEKEKDYLKNVGHHTDIKEAFCIKYPGKKDLPAAVIWIIKDTACIKVTNIIPAEPVRSLARVEYNAILDEFDATIVKPVVAQTGVSRVMSQGDKSIEQILGARTAALLRSFSASANKSTGSSHPCDRERWFEFIIASHVDEASIATEDLARWLEEDGWRDEKLICELICEYEFARGLLKRYQSESKKKRL